MELRGSKEDSRRGSRREEAEEESYADAVASLDEGGDDERGKRKKRKKKKDKDRERRDDAPAEEAPPPVDGRVLHCLDAATGEPIWMLQQHDIKLLLGDRASAGHRRRCADTDRSFVRGAPVP